ncbi:hypothetical protein EDM21_08285 [Paenibacillus sp. N10]|uniref:Uncharacterized protein n=2 Tax=Paenibacillus lutrae TaxID=2078573 RepID=A0A7X3JYZ2_9BACL|nr:hypothetical protein [Paenibacillus lutrae]
MIKMWRKNSAAALLSTTLLFSSAAAVITPTAAYAADKSDYPKFYNVAKQGPVTPGLVSDKKWVPQGMAVWSSKKWIISSYYSSSKADASSLMITEKDSKDKRVRTYYLYNEDGSKHMGHVGGLAISGKYLWVASGTDVYRIPLSTISGSKDYAKLKMKKYDLKHKASYATFRDGVLWVGEYTEGSTQCSKGSKGTVYGYKLSSSEGISTTPTYKWKTPDRVQGMALTKDQVIYSQSCGRNNSSKLLIHKRGYDGAKVKDLTLPPMAEGIAFYGSNLYVSFESGSQAYPNGKHRLKNYFYLNPSKI